MKRFTKCLRQLCITLGQILLKPADLSMSKKIKASYTSATVMLIAHKKLAMSGISSVTGKSVGL